ncbi:MAG: ribonuclease P protein component [Patescibacteria group bacterium]|nr:ribonuclease P protein component [Patescibacteria group bacterium]
MLARPQRLVKQKGFEKIFKQGRACYTQLLGVRVLASQVDFNRFGIVVSTKISKKAVERNKLKRRIRRALQELNKNLVVGFDAIIIALPGLLNENYRTVADELKKIFVKFRLLK